MCCLIINQSVRLIFNQILLFDKQPIIVQSNINIIWQLYLSSYKLKIVLIAILYSLYISIAIHWTSKMPPSRVWSYFTRSSDKKQVTCNLCKQEFVYKGTTSNLLNHLNGQHPSTTETTKQSSMNSFINTPKKKTDWFCSYHVC